MPERPKLSLPLTPLALAAGIAGAAKRVGYWRYWAVPSPCWWRLAQWALPVGVDEA